ncbi:hypothetical protein DL797_00610 [Klebsiella pneumoniae]|nr:hypothetical protein DL797_00610 [Klebsiella pneumoniae]
MNSRPPHTVNVGHILMHETWLTTQTTMTNANPSMEFKTTIDHGHNSKAVFTNIIRDFGITGYIDNVD